MQLGNIHYQREVKMKKNNMKKPMKNNKIPKPMMSDIEVKRRNDAKRIGEELGWNAWTYVNPTREQTRNDL